MKIFGYILTALAVIQAYLWVFGVIDLEPGFRQASYFIIVCTEFVCGLLGAKIITGL